MPRKQDQKNLYRRGKTWWIKATVNGKTIRESTKTSDLAEARKVRDRLLAPLTVKDDVARQQAVAAAVLAAEKRQQEAVEAARDKPTVAGAWAAYLADPRRPQSAPSTMRDYSQRWAKFATWWASHAPDRPELEAITRADVAAFTAFLDREHLCPNRYNQIVQTATLVFRLVAPDGAPNHFADVHRRRLATRNHRELTEAELRAVMNAAQGDMRLLFALGLFTLLRLGDCATLRWAEIDLEGDRIHRKPRKTAARSGKVVSVAIHPVLRALLEETPRSARQGPVLPEIAARYERDRSAVSKAVQAHFKACGIATTEETEYAKKIARVGFHSLRHSGASLMARAGTPQATLQYLLGHASPALQSVYVHTNGADVSRAVAALPNPLAAITSEVDANTYRASETSEMSETCPLSAAERLARIEARLAQEPAASPLARDLRAILES